MQVSFMKEADEVHLSRVLGSHINYLPICNECFVLLIDLLLYHLSLSAFS